MDKELSYIERRIFNQLVKSKISLNEAEAKLRKVGYSKERVKGFMDYYLKEQFGVNKK